MKIIRQVLCALRLRREPRPARYGAEVLLAGWVELPAAFRELAAARGRARFRTTLAAPRHEVRA